MTTLTQAIEANDQLALLVAMRNKIAAVIDEGVNPRDLASLSRRLIDLAAEVRTLEAAETHPRGRALKAVQDLSEPFDPSTI